MKKLILALTLLGASLSYSQDVYIPDQNFLNALITNGVDTSSDGKIQEGEALRFGDWDVWLYLSNSNIYDLTGIEAFENLVNLNIDFNHLTELHLNLPHLQSLRCYNTDLSLLDVSDLPSLHYLECRNNQLTTLNLSQNLVLRNVECANNLLESLEVPTSLLGSFDCSDNKLTHLDLSSVSGLTMINCDNNDLQSLNINGITNLTELVCQNNELTSLDVSSNTSLKTLYAGENRLQSLILGNHPTLENLYCQNNNLSELDLSNTSLVYVSLSGTNSITCTGILPNTLYQIDVPKTVICIPNIPDGLRYYVDGVGGPSNEPLLCRPSNNEDECHPYPSIQGTVFYDLNSNSIHDDTEYVSQNIPVHITPMNATIITDHEGFFNYYVSSLDTFNVSILAPEYYDTQSSYEVIFTNYSDISYTSIALQPNRQRPLSKHFLPF